VAAARRAVGSVSEEENVEEVDGPTDAMVSVDLVTTGFHTVGGVAGAVTRDPAVALGEEAVVLAWSVIAAPGSVGARDVIVAESVTVWVGPTPAATGPGVEVEVSGSGAAATGATAEMAEPSPAREEAAPGAAGDALLEAVERIPLHVLVDRVPSCWGRDWPALLCTSRV
jgi:hypothetical protein